MFVVALCGCAWLLLSGWESDSPRDRLVDVLVSTVALLLAAGVTFPNRSHGPFRLVAGIVGSAYALYFADELIGLVRGKPQTLRIGEPSALMAGLGFLIIGAPLLVFALLPRRHDTTGDEHGPVGGDGPAV